MKSALIIGNNEYENDVFSKLNSPAADTKAFADVLRDTNIGEFNEVSELHNDSYVEVRVAIETFFLDKKPDDLILLYFSGHGVLENNKLYLAVKNTRRNKLKATGISTPFINECMDDCRYRRIVLILDCCHSGAFVPGIKGDQPAVTEETFHAQGYGHTIITASDKLQYAIDGNTPIQQSELSLFTHHLLYGLKTGEADLDEDGLVSLEEWYQYSYRKVLEGTNQQTPCKWSNKQQGDLIIAKSPRKKELSPAELPTEIMQSLTSSFPELRAGAAEALGRLLADENGELVEPAKTALQAMKNDDSSQVRATVHRILEKLAGQDEDSGPTDILLGSLSNWHGKTWLRSNTSYNHRHEESEEALGVIRIGHNDSVNGIAIRPDGQRAISAQWDRNLKVWDLESSKELLSLTGHSGPVKGVAVTPDSRGAISASADKTLKLWDLESGKELLSLAGHNGPVNGVAVTPDGQRAISASWDKILKVWDLESGRELRSLIGHTMYVYAVAVTPDGRRAVSASSDKTIKLWDLENGKEMVTFIADEALHCISISSDGKRAISGDGAGRVYFLDLMED